MLRASRRGLSRAVALWRAPAGAACYEAALIPAAAPCPALSPSFAPLALFAPSAVWARGFAAPARRRPGPRDAPEGPMRPPKNREIQAAELRVVFPDGDDRGTVVLPLDQALREAESLDLDLVLIAPTAKPPVARIAKYDKLLYELRKKAKASARALQEQQKLADPKEIRVGVRSAEQDRELKMAKVRGVVWLEMKGGVFIAVEVGRSSSTMIV